jgi:hypothetical protein
MLDVLRAGESRVLVVRGEAGVGSWGSGGARATASFRADNLAPS